MWILKVLSIVLMLEVFLVLAVPAPKRPSSHVGTGLGTGSLVGTGSQAGSGSHGGAGSHGSQGSLGGTGSHAGAGSQGGTVTSSHSRPKPKPGANTNTDRNTDCQLIFNVGQTSDGKPTVTSIKFPELTRMLNNQEGGSTRDNICNLIFAMNPTFISQQDVAAKPGYLPSKPIKPTIVHDIDKKQARSDQSPDAIAAEKDIVDELEKQIYEHQLAVWPTDIEEVIDVLRPQEQHSIAYPAWSTGNGASVVPLYEDQIVVFPEFVFDDFGTDEEYEEHDESWPTAPKPTSKPDQENIKVLQNLNLVHLNGTSEHKLVLSNGLVNYKKIYNKLVDGKVITVQEGYDSIPIPGTHNTEFNTQFYIADEHGYNVYSVEHNSQPPALPGFLSYRDQVAAAKKTENI